MHIYIKFLCGKEIAGKDYFKRTLISNFFVIGFKLRLILYSVHVFFENLQDSPYSDAIFTNMHDKNAYK